MATIYKILTSADFEQALASGHYQGSTVDLADGYIHFSTADQVRETARRHFRGKADLVLVPVDTDRIGQDLVWEPARDGSLFPHLYGSLPATAMGGAVALPLDAEGLPTVPDPLP